MSSHRISAKRSISAGVVVLVAALSAVVPTATAGAQVKPSAEHVGQGGALATIMRNSYGVPSVYSATTNGMWFGTGWAQAQDRLVQLELTRRAVEGTLSAVFGPSELGQDETVRTLFYTPAELAAQFRAAPAPTRRAIVNFTAGINAYERYAYTDPATRVPFEFFVLGKALGLSTAYRPAPWTPEDSVAVGNYLAREFGGGGGSELQNLSFVNYLQAELAAKGNPAPIAGATAIFNDARWLNDPTAPTTVPGGGGSRTRPEPR